MNRETIQTIAAAGVGVPAPLWLPIVSNATEVMGFAVAFISLIIVFWNLIDKIRKASSGAK